jgi:hypothetical protein
MPEKPIDIIILQRLDDEQKKILERLGKIEDRILGFGVSVGRIEGAMEPPREIPWWVRFILAPLLVAASIATVTAVILDYVKVARIETYLHDNGGFIAGLRLQQNAADPNNPQRIADVQQVLKSARKNKVVIPLDVVESAGKKFMDVSQSNPDAWSAALSFVDYRSFLNSGSLPPLSAGIRRHSKDDNYELLLNLSNDYGRPKDPLGISDQFLVGSATPEEAARIEFMPNPPKTSSGAKFIVLDWHRSDVALILDMTYLKNIVIRNATVRYGGGPVRLENVYFVNCTFEVPARPVGQSFAETVLSHGPATTFTAS